MKEYDFILRFSLADSCTDLDECVELLGEAGCDDALIGIGKSGRLALDFSREADSAIEAVLSAIRDVRRGLPDATLTEAAPDLVGITDAAELVGCTRQNLRQLLLNCEFATPAPVHESPKSSVWHLAQLLKWLRDTKRYTIEDQMLDLAEVNMQINITAEEHYADPGLRREIRSIFA